MTELRCTYDPATQGGNAPDGRKVKATIHWVSAAHSIPAEVRLYNPLFTKPDPSGGENFTADLNPNSLEIAEPVPGSSRRLPTPSSSSLSSSSARVISASTGIPKSGKPVFSRTIGLRDTWAKDWAKDQTRTAPRPQAD